MKTWRAEYKFFLGLIVVFIGITIFALTKKGYVAEISTSYKKKNLTNCSESKFTKGIEYTNYVCTIQDETGDSYTIDYPQIAEKSKEIKQLNQQLKKQYDQIYHAIDYKEINQKLEFSHFQKINYKVYYGKGVASFMVEEEDVVGVILNRINQYKIYNIDASTYKILNPDQMKEKLGIDRSFSSSLKGFIVKMYLEKFRYDYNNELEVYRDANIDDTIQGITYHTIQSIYVDDEECIHFLLYLYNPDYGDVMPYNFTMNTRGTFSYEMLD